MAEEDESGAGKQVIARAAAVLRALENRTGSLSLGQIARATGLPRTTVQRLVAALEAQQLVTAGAGGVALGPALARLAASAHTDIVGLSRPHLEVAGRLTRETVNLSVMRGEHAILVDQYASDQELRVVSPIGAALPLHSTAHGKAMLAELDDAAIRALLSRPLEARTARAINTIEALLDAVAAIRGGRVAEDLGEHADGVVGIGLALRVPTSDRYGLSIALPQVRLAASRERVVNALLRCAGAIEAASGTGLSLPQPRKPRS